MCVNCIFAYKQTETKLEKHHCWGGWGTVLLEVEKSLPKEDFKKMLELSEKGTVRRTKDDKELLLFHF